LISDLLFGAAWFLVCSCLLLVLKVAVLIFMIWFLSLLGLIVVFQIPLLRQILFFVPLWHTWSFSINFLAILRSSEVNYYGVANCVLDKIMIMFCGTLVTSWQYSVVLMWTVLFSAVYILKQQRSISIKRTGLFWQTSFSF
jgi:hypothetical protein